MTEDQPTNTAEKGMIRLVRHYKMTPFGLDLFNAEEALLSELEGLPKSLDDETVLEAGKKYISKAIELAIKHGHSEGFGREAAATMLHPEYAKRLGLTSPGIESYFKQKEQAVLLENLNQSEDYQRIQKRREELHKELDDLRKTESDLIKRMSEK